MRQWRLKLTSSKQMILSNITDNSFEDGDHENSENCKLCVKLKLKDIEIEKDKSQYEEYQRMIKNGEYD